MSKTKERPTLLERGWIAGMAYLAVAGLLAGCQRSAPPAATTQATATQGASRPTVNTVSERLKKSTKILMDTLEHPKTPFHYSYKGQQNVTEHYAFNKTLKPQVGTVTMEADVSPDEMIITSTNKGQPAAFEDRTAAGAAFTRIARRLLGEDVPFQVFDEADGLAERFARLFRRKQ
jgi:hypothetical protein